MFRLKRNIHKEGVQAIEGENQQTSHELGDGCNCENVFRSR